MTDKLILFMYQAWYDLDRVIDGLTPQEATDRFERSSSIAWTVGHVTTQIDSWMNMRIQGLDPHPVFDRETFRTGGSGEADNWLGILEGMQDVRESARRFLDADPGPDLDLLVPYDGAIEYLRETGLSLRFALMTIAAHHFLHVGEITTVRSHMGHAVGDGPNWGRTFV